MKFILFLLLAMGLSFAAHAQQCKNALAPDKVMCDAGTCSQLASQPSYHAVCSCKDTNGNPIPSCTPQNSSYPMQTNACVNSKTKETKSMQDCRTLMGQSDDWDMQPCYCCCGA